MKRQMQQNNIVFLSVPESIQEQMKKRSVEDFVIDPSIPIPVEIPPGEEQLNLEELSWEMILSGMIKVVAQEPDHEDADYYRNFVLAVKPDILKEFSEAAILKARNKDFDMAQEILQALQGLFPNSQEVRLNRALVQEELATALEDEGRVEDAELATQEAFTLYKELLAETSPIPNALFNAGFFYIQQRNYEKARECFIAYLPVADNDRKKAKAQTIINEIERHNLNDELLKEAYDFIRLGEEQQGLEKIHEFLIRNPEVWNGWFILGWGLRRLERWEEASASFRKALEFGGEGCDTRNELAICLMEMGDFQGARKELERALRIEPENIKVLSNLGVLSMKQGNQEEARGFFRTVLEIAPEDTMAKQLLSQLGEE